MRRSYWPWEDDVTVESFTEEAQRAQPPAPNGTEQAHAPAPPPAGPTLAEVVARIAAELPQRQAQQPQLDATLTQLIGLANGALALNQWWAEQLQQLQAAAQGQRRDGA